MSRLLGKAPLSAFAQSRLSALVSAPLSAPLFAALLVSALVPGLAPAQVPAQDASSNPAPAVVLTLDDAIRRAQLSSPGSRIARLRLEQAEWSYRSFQSDYLPTLSFNGSAPGLERSITDIQQDDGSVRYVEQSRTLARAGLSISQNVPLTGGTLSLSSGISRINQFGDFDFSQWQSSPLVVGLSQPIRQFNALKWNRRVRPIQNQVDQQFFLEEMAGVAVEVAGFFFDVLIAQMDLDNAVFNIAVNDTIYGLSQGRYQIGAIAENDLLQSELALLNAQSSEATARVDLERAKQNLKTALGLDVDVPLTVDPPALIPDDDVDPDVAVAQATRNQSAFRNFELERIEARRDVAQARRSNGLSANLTAQIGFNQSAEQFDAVYQSLLNSQRLSVSLQVPIVQWGRGKAEVQQAVADMERVEASQELERRELSQEVYFEAVRFVQLREQVAIAGKADTVATRRFEVARNRYTIGRIDVTDLFDAQAEKDAARTAYTRTLRDCWVSYYRLRQLTLYDFGRGVPLLY